MANLQAPTGMHDLWGEQLDSWRRIEQTVHELMGEYGYEELRTPLMEYTSLFVRSIGMTTDIVEKEMYTFEGGEESVALRPEMTAPVARAYLEHGMHRSGAFRKLYYLGPFFRRERPQKGRFRQFHQVGVEVFGTTDPLADVEVIELSARLFERLELPGVELHLNSIGCPACRPRFRGRLREYFQQRLDRLCETCRRRYERNVFRILDCKQQKCREQTAGAPTIAGDLCEDCRSHIARVEEGLRRVGLASLKAPHLFRGFDYYTRTIFEFLVPTLGAQNSVCGGGRYDQLIEQLGGPPTGAVGLALGVERLVLALREAGRLKAGAPPIRKLEAFFATVRPEDRLETYKLLSQLRAAGVAAVMDLEGRGLKGQLRVANRSGARTVVVVGPDELERGMVRLKDMHSGEEREVPLDGIVSAIRADGS